MSLQRKLARIRAERASKGLTGTRKQTHFGKVGETQLTERGIERPNVDAISHWLPFVGEALRRFGVCWAWRVSAEHFEDDGCVSLYLQRVVHVEEQAGAIMAGAAMVTPGTRQVPVGGGVWQRYRVPTGLINNHDTRALLRLVLAPKDVDLVIAGSQHLRAMNGL
jgi:hypothetical protein